MSAKKLVRNVERSFFGRRPVETEALLFDPSK